MEADFQTAKIAVHANGVVALRRVLEKQPPVPDGAPLAICRISEEGRTLLDEAIQAGSADCLELLLDSGADPAGNASWEPLHSAVHCGALQCVEILIRSGAPVDIRRPGPETTPLQAAAIAGRTDCIRALVSAGADLDSRDCHGRSTLILAVTCGQAAAVRELARLGAPLESRVGDGGTALVVAVVQGRADCARELLAAGADMTAPLPQSSVDSLVTLAVYSDVTSASLETLLHFGADPSALIACGRPLLSLAVCGTSKTATWALLEAGAMVSRRALMLAEVAEAWDDAAMLLARMCAGRGGAAALGAATRMLVNPAVLGRALAVAQWRYEVALGEEAVASAVRGLQASVLVQVERAAVSQDSDRQSIAGGAVAVPPRLCSHACLRACLRLLSSWPSIAFTAASGLPLAATAAERQAAAAAVLEATEASTAVFLRPGLERTAAAADAGTADAQPPAAPGERPRHGGGPRAPLLFLDSAVLPQQLHSLGPPRAVMAAAAGRELARCVADALSDAPERSLACLAELPFRLPAGATGARAQYAAVRCVGRWGELIAADRIARAAQAQAEASLAAERIDAAAAVEVLEAAWLLRQRGTREAEQQEVVQ